MSKRSRAGEAERGTLKEQKKRRSRRAEAAARRSRRASARRRTSSSSAVAFRRAWRDRRANVEKLQTPACRSSPRPPTSRPALGLDDPRACAGWRFTRDAAMRVALHPLHRSPRNRGGVRSSPPRTRPRRCAGMDPAQHPRRRFPRTMPPTASSQAAAPSPMPRRTSARDVVVNADLKDFFPTITFPRVAGIFQRTRLFARRCDDPRLALHRIPAPRSDLRRRQTSRRHGAPRLPQGACTSPALSNLAARATRFPPDRHRPKARLGLHALRRRPDLLGHRAKHAQKDRLSARRASATSRRTKVSPSTKRRRACSADTRAKRHRGSSSTSARAPRESRCDESARSCIVPSKKGSRPRIVRTCRTFEAWLARHDRVHCNDRPRQGGKACVGL